jgi:endonuclease-3
MRRCGEQRTRRQLIKSRMHSAVAIIKKLQVVTYGMQEPAASIIIKEFGKYPFFILISCLLSLRTKDLVSLVVSRRLFEQVKTPFELVCFPIDALQELIYSIGFFRKKSQLLIEVSQELINRFDGAVPSNEADLLSIKGVGRKTANLVLGYAFDIPAICVDVHVHRISNRLGLVNTKTPYETELALKEILPVEYWITYNRLLVMWGQNVCLPIAPLCSTCPIADICDKKT